LREYRRPGCGQKSGDSQKHSSAFHMLLLL
jgi:hypothetical protein